MSGRSSTTKVKMTISKSQVISDDQFKEILMDAYLSSPDDYTTEFYYDQEDVEDKATRDEYLMNQWLELLSGSGWNETFNPSWFANNNTYVQLGNHIIKTGLTKYVTFAITVELTDGYDTTGIKEKTIICDGTGDRIRNFIDEEMKQVVRREIRWDGELVILDNTHEKDDGTMGIATE